MPAGCLLERCCCWFCCAGSVRWRYRWRVCCVTFLSNWQNLCLPFGRCAFRYSIVRMFGIFFLLVISFAAMCGIRIDRWRKCIALHRKFVEMSFGACYGNKKMHPCWPFVSFGSFLFVSFKIWANLMGSRLLITITPLSNSIYCYCSLLWHGLCVCSVLENRGVDNLGAAGWGDNTQWIFILRQI